MANKDILLEFSLSDVSHFKKDFMQLVKVGTELDKAYGKEHDMDFAIEKFEKLVEQFNRKYKGIQIKTQRQLKTIN